VKEAKGTQCFNPTMATTIHGIVGRSRPDQLAGQAASAADFSEGDAVQVLWKGKWYDAHVRKQKANSISSTTTAITIHGMNGWDRKGSKPSSFVGRLRMPNLPFSRSDRSPFRKRAKSRFRAIRCHRMETVSTDCKHLC
jgi:hypothetical protein